MPTGWFMNRLTSILLLAALLWPSPALAVFPETTIVSTFSGVDNTPAIGFTDDQGSASMEKGGAYTAASEIAEGLSHWNAGSYTQPVDAHITYSAQGANGSYYALCFCQNLGATANGYLVYNEFGTGDLTVWKMTGGLSGTLTQLGSAIHVTVAPGDGLGARLHTSGTIEVFTKTAAGAWTSKGSRGPDTTYTGEFYVALNVHRGATDGVTVTGTTLDSLGIGEAVEDEGGGAPPTSHRSLRRAVQ